MKVTETKVTIRELVEGYEDKKEEGVFSCKGTLDIRPPYQREFIYKDKQQEEVIRSILQGFPLNTMYWADTGNGRFEVLDGQQRTISICKYVSGVFSVDGQFFENLEKEQQRTILDYILTVYRCSGTSDEKLAWFEVVNVSGEALNKQELRNAVYHGEWLTECKRRFSKTGGPAYVVGGPYMSGSPIRQDYLQTVLSWISDGDIEGYMAANQKKGKPDELWEYYRDVMDWTKSRFPETLSGVKSYPRELKKVQWGELYNRFRNDKHDIPAMQADLKRLMLDDEVTKLSGIFEYLLSGDEKVLNIRTFDDRQKTAMYARQDGVCASCGESFAITDMEGDHVVPWSLGGKTHVDNGQMLCKKCNRSKGKGI